MCSICGHREKLKRCMRCGGDGGEHRTAKYKVKKQTITRDIVDGYCKGCLGYGFVTVTI